MKKTGNNARGRDIQRASVQRAQKTGRRRAARSAGRLGAEPAPPPVSSRSSPGDVSVDIPYGLRRAFVAGLIVLALAAIGAVVAQNWPAVRPLLPAAAGGDGTAAPSPSPAPSAAPSPAASPEPNRIGLVSGHRGNDSGTVCSDGLTEAEVNYDIASRVSRLLRAQGYKVEILDEFDPRLKGYVALSLVSIHADSCTYINDLATGFKVARVLDSRIPDQEDRLVACLTARYRGATGMTFHARTVTRDMTQYHAFNEIDGNTPAAIIETGFMYLDRAILTRKPGQVAQGVADGILCFLNHEQP